MSEAATGEDSRSGVRRIWLNGALSILVILTLLAGAFIIGERQRRQVLFEREIGRRARRIDVDPHDGPPGAGGPPGHEPYSYSYSGNGIWSMTCHLERLDNGRLEGEIEGVWASDGWQVAHATLRFREHGASGWTFDRDVTELVADLGPKQHLLVPSLEVRTAAEE